MNALENGKLIAKLRKEAGYTQKTLAEALFVTDKAVSKWERGLCMPDSSLLVRLSMLLDADIEYLISGEKPYGEHKWVGELRVDNLRGMVARKPLIYYLLSYFMLVGITDIAVLSNDKEYVEDLNLKKYGLNISYMPFGSDRTMIVYDKFLLFGVNITRQLQQGMQVQGNVSFALHGKDIPIVFSHCKSTSSMEKDRKESEVKSLGRGTIYIPLNTEGELEDASVFVETYEKYHGMSIADLNEIAVLRGLV